MMQNTRKDEVKYKTIINNLKKIDSYNEHIIRQNDLKIEIKEIINSNSNIFKNISFE